MDITLKKVKIIDSMSEETLCFTADVYENGKSIGIAQNQGHGGPTDVYLNPEHRKNETEHAQLEEIIDELVYAIDAGKQQAKIQKKLEKDSIKYICVGAINKQGASYSAQGFTPTISLAGLVARPNGLLALQRMYDRIKSEIKGDETILNTNLGALGVKL